MNNDLISREALKECARVVFDKDLGRLRVVDVSDIDNAPTVYPLLNLENITEEDIEKFKIIWQRANSKGLRAIIDNAPTVEPCYQTTSCLDCKNYDKENHNCPRYCEVIKEAIKSRPQGEYFDMSKLRLMTVEECAGHTIDYAMGWKACIEWIKKGGAE